MATRRFVKLYFKKDEDIWIEVMNAEENIEVLEKIRKSVMVDGYMLIGWEEWYNDDLSFSKDRTEYRITD
ncbi:hypothetical protein [Methanococcus voltae]|uniref:Uncharacterized protein n=2 Tax=Methanococcus voltae TaxID=2188 RepID=A0A8J7RFS8_METVO|nr:hypothetical protein [Methanococcus voltae]MBP2171993.1 hypothetical protein [Methanococcus voltae]MBP2201052.1 hypothetical protein [Methanococcus voltae]MCS3921774.1 hypothetical protein [Methanococcus voltae PS]